VEVERLKERLGEGERVIAELKHQLLCQENQNVNNDLMIQQLKMETKKENQSKSSLFEKEQTTVQGYEGEIRKLKDTLSEKNACIKTLQKDLAGLERNERTLLDRISKYEKELEHLQNTMRTYSAQRKDQLKVNNSEAFTGRKVANEPSPKK
jgi:chromosome segregation ATPase